LTLLRAAPAACPHKAGFNEPGSVRIAAILAGPKKNETIVRSVSLLGQQ
jgi:hypothetical protein